MGTVTCSRPINQLCTNSSHRCNLKYYDCHLSSCCVNHSTKELDEVLCYIDTKISEIARAHLDFAHYGYPVDCSEEMSFYIKIKQNRDTIYKHFYSLYKGISGCLSCEQIQRVVESSRVLLAKNSFIKRQCSLYHKDETDKGVWNAENPYCVSREVWEKMAYKVCDDLGFNMSVINLTDACDIAFSTIVTPQLCDIIADFKVEKRNCEIQPTFSVSEEKCQMDYNLLVTQTKCNIDYKFYKELISCNLTADIIKTAYGCGLSFELSKEDKNCVTVVSLTGTRINLCDIDMKINLSNPNC